MKILTNKNRVARVVFMVSLNYSHNDESSYENLLFNNKYDAVAEFDEQLKIIKTDKS